MGEEVHEEARAQEAHRELERAHERSERQREPEIAALVARGERRDAGRDQEGDHRHGTHRELARGPEQSVHDEGRHGRVEAVHRGQPRDHRVRHALGDEHHADGEAGGRVPAEVSAPVPGERPEKRKAS